MVCGESVSTAKTVSGLLSVVWIAFTKMIGDAEIVANDQKIH